MSRYSLFLLVSHFLLLLCPATSHSENLTFEATDLPNSLGEYDSIGYLDLNSNGLLLANGYDSETGESTPLLINSDGSNLRTIKSPADIRGIFLQGFISDSGVGYIFQLGKGSTKKLFSFDETGNGQEISIEVGSDSTLFVTDVTSSGKLVVSIGPEGGPFRHLLISANGTQEQLPERFNESTVLVGPNTLLGFNSLSNSPPYTVPPAHLLDLESNSDQTIDSATIGAIVSSTKLWLTDLSKKLLWIRDNGKDSKKISTVLNQLFASSDGGIYANRISISDNAAYITTKLETKIITCEFPSGSASRKYRDVLAVSGNKALVSYTDLKKGKQVGFGSALISFSKDNRKSFCAPIKITNTNQCKLKKVTSRYFEFPRDTTTKCNFEIRLSGSLAQGNTPVTISTTSSGGSNFTQKRKQLIAKNGVLKFSQELTPDTIVVSISAPKEGFKKFHGQEIQIAPEN